MNFLKRLYYYSTGFIIGIIFLIFILNGKRASCNYTPNARVIDNITSKELIFNKSEPKNKPCGIYFIKSGDLNLNIINCENEATVKIN